MPIRDALREWLKSDRPLWDSVDRETVRKIADKIWGTSPPNDELGQSLVRCFLLDQWLEVFNVH